MLSYLTGKQLNKAGHCEEESDHEPTVSQGKINCCQWAHFCKSIVFMTDTELESIVNKSIERSKETAKLASNASSFPVLIKVRLIILSRPHVQGIN